MKITVTAPTGNIGSVIVQKLVEGDSELTVVARSPEKVASLAERGARVVQGSLDDISVVRRAVEGADALFWLSPPNYATENFRAYYNSLGDVVAQVAGDNPELHVVNLSSTGAHLGEGVGPVKGLHDVEQKLNAATRRVTHLRPTYFMENVLPSLGSVASDGAIYSTIPAEVTVEQIATRDIGAIAAETLLAGAPDSSKVIHILGPEAISFAQVASEVSAAIGKSVSHVVVSADQLRGPMAAMGLSADVVEQLLELENAITQSLVSPPPGSTVRTGATSFAQFAREVVAAAYKQSAGAASA